MYAPCDAAGQADHVTTPPIKDQGRGSRPELAGVLRLESFRLESFELHGTGWMGLKSGITHAKGAYNLLGPGQIAVTGAADQVAIETGRSASQTNTAQNTGATGSTVTGNNPEPTPNDLPL